MTSERPLILSIGSINADFQVRVGRRPEVSETLVGEDFLRAGGGKAANVALVATRLGLAARLIGRVGEDDLADQALAPLRQAGVDVSTVTRAPSQATGVAMITVPPDGKKGIVLAPNANETWADAERDRALAAVRQAPRGSLLVADCEVPVGMVEATSEAATSAGLRRVLDPSPADRVTERVLRAADVAVPNPAEAETLTGIAVDGEDSALEAARALRGRCVGVACVKLPDGGCVLDDGTSAHRIEAPEVEVVDTTGAGDAFAGALAAALAEGGEMLDAACLAVAVSTHAVTSYGSQASYPERPEADARLASVVARRLG